LEAISEIFTYKIFSPPPQTSFLTAYTPGLSEHFKTSISTKEEELTLILKMLYVSRKM
jgi:hypothetical protein